MDESTAVSYTHLDVYKRQSLYCNCDFENVSLGIYIADPSYIPLICKYLQVTLLIQQKKRLYNYYIVRCLSRWKVVTVDQSLMRELHAFFS